MSARPSQSPRFVRKTQLALGEYRKNFRQIDADVIAAITSEEADRVTPLMSKIYLRLVSAPAEFWEREGVLYFAARETDGGLVKASKALYEVLGVASATAHKALRWMHGQGIIGYFAGKNGVGIRVFLNRAASSIGSREGTVGKKILPFARGSSGARGGSTLEPAFNDSFADPEVLDSDSDPRAPEGGAGNGPIGKPSFESKYPPPAPSPSGARCHAALALPQGTLSLEEVVTRLRAELEPIMHTAARQAAAREQERTREWLESRGLPKAARVAQHEAYSVLRKYGVIDDSARAARARAVVGRNDYVRPGPQPLTRDEVAELAESCVAMLEAKGQPVDLTLSEMSAEAGGFLLPADAARVREMVNLMVSAGAGGEGE